MGVLCVFIRNEKTKQNLIYNNTVIGDSDEKCACICHLIKIL